MKTYYDKLFTQENGIKLYADYVFKYLKDGSVLELACGSGDLLNLMSENHEVLGVDLDPEMLKQTAIKFPMLKDKIVMHDFLTFKSDKKYDNLVCIGDSLNYILSEEDLIQFLDNAGNLSDHLILDSHHPARLLEFQDGYYEEGSTDTFDYAYEISCEDEYLLHVINFLDGHYDVINQWVFDPNIVIKHLKSLGYDVTVLNDFTEGDIHKEGEKVRYVATRSVL